MSTITRQQAQQIIEAADAVITALAGTNEDVHPDNSTKMVRLYDDLNDHYAPPEVVRELARIAQASLEAEPVGYMNRFTGRVFTLEEQPGADTDVQVYVPVYTAPPEPVSVPDLKKLDEILCWILMLPVPTPRATHFAKQLSAWMDDYRAGLQQHLKTDPH